MVTPIIFIPGVEGTTLINTNSMDYTQIWGMYDSLATSIGTPQFTYALKDNPVYDQDDNSIVTKGHIARLPYQDSLKAIQDKTECPVFLFGYDWRKSNNENAVNLMAFVVYLKQKLSVTAFHFVTHSMGGLIFSCYLKQLNGNYSDIAKIVMAAPPFKGSVYALVHLAIGNAGIHSIFNPNDLSRKANRTFPSVYELCPWYEGAVTFASNGTDADLTNPANWQTNIYDDITTLFANRLSALNNFRTNQLMDLSVLPDLLKKNTIVIAGEGESTHNKVIIKNASPSNTAQNYFDFDSPTGDGDGTVPIESSTFYKDILTTIAIKKTIWHLPDNFSYHGLFLKDARVQNVISRFIMNNTQSSDWWTSVSGAERIV